MHEYIREMHEAVFASRERDFLTVAEAPGATVDEALLFTDPARREVDMVFTFEHMDFDHGDTKWDNRPVDIPGLKQNLAAWQNGLAGRGWNSLYWCNHDQPRIVSRYGDDGRFWRESATLLATVLHLHRGTPYVYQGEEIGMTNFPFSDPGQCRDIEAVNHYRQAVEVQGEDPAGVFAGIRAASRDNARTPMQWDDGENAGFTTGIPWIPVNPDHVRLNVQAQQSDPDSVLTHYKRLIALRHEDPVVRDGHFELLLADHPCLWVFTRTLGGEQLLVAANASGDPVEVPFPLSGQVVLGNYPQARGQVLQPWEARVLRRGSGDGG
jgi:oligo-1,6-glucosidase